MATSLTLNNGMKMPLLGLGTWKSKPGQVEAAVELALRKGYRHLDCAAIYGNEAEVGAAIVASGVARSDIFITSKLWNTKHHPEDVEGACRKTLADLGVDYLDLYLVHSPVAFERGDGVELYPMNEDGTFKFSDIHPTTTWLAMEKLVKKGLTKSIGLSNFNSEQITDVLEKGSLKPVTNQVECHPYLGQGKLFAFCKERGITITAYSPLGSPDRPWAKPGEPLLMEDPKIKAIANKHSKSPAQVLIRWQVQRGVVVIPKSVTAARIEENANIFDFQLSAGEMKEIESFEKGRLSPMEVFSAHPHYPFHIEF
jgi:diketogulonate reductase-like aldo/keto reductase